MCNDKKDCHELVRLLILLLLASGWEWKGDRPGTSKVGDMVGVTGEVSWRGVCLSGVSVSTSIVSGFSGPGVVGVRGGVSTSSLSGVTLEESGCIRFGIGCCCTVPSGTVA